MEIGRESGSMHSVEGRSSTRTDEESESSRAELKRFSSLISGIQYRKEND